jgi:glycosyltransferase involved in cell wall biosynthesis
MTCYASGTQIAVRAGERPVETLRIGDLVRTASGALRAIRWIGRRSYAGLFFASNERVHPVRFRAGALGRELPHRDLLVSPAHCMLLDGMLVPAERLLNGNTILQEHGIDRVEYLHVELDTHDVLLAEGAPSESFVDDGSRGMFQNAGEYHLLYPGAAPVPGAVFCAPRLESGEMLERLRWSLAALAEPSTPPGPLDGFLDGVGAERVSGWAQDRLALDATVRLRVTDNGVVLGEVLAGRHRPDLAAAGIGDHAFELVVSGGLSPALRHVIDVRRVKDGQALAGSPYVIEAKATAAPRALPAPQPPAMPWHGRLDVATRERIAGWARDAACDAPVGLQVLDNGVVLARVLANRMRLDLVETGIGTGGYGFDITVPGGLCPFMRHVIDVLREDDGSPLPGSPIVVEPAYGLDGALQQAMEAAVAALPAGGEHGRVLSFTLAQAEKLMQQRADDDGQIRLREEQRRASHRFGASAAPCKPGWRALVLDARCPTAGRDPGSAVLLSHIAALQDLGYAVTFAAADEMARGVDPALRSLGVEVCAAPFYGSIEDVLHRWGEGLDLVYLHRVDMASRYLSLAREHAPRARIVYNVADLHHVRLARQAALEGRPALLETSGRIRAAECLAALQADAVVTHSAVEAEWLREAVPSARVHVVPWSVSPRPRRRPFAKRAGVAFIGAYGDAPNLDAAAWLVHDVMPAVWERRPGIECLLAGSEMPKAMRAMRKPGIMPLGEVGDLSAVFDQVRLTVAPTRFGAGVDGKVVDSLAAALPCVMTQVAAEGIALPPLLSQWIGQSACELASLIVQLHDNPALNRASAVAGFDLMTQVFSETAVKTGLGAALAPLTNAPVSSSPGSTAPASHNGGQAAFDIPGGIST